MGRVFLMNLEGSFYSCRHCRTPFFLTHDIMSKNFTCTTGTAYLCDNVVNVTVGEKYDQSMMTGKYITVDIFCVTCGSRVGWKYEFAYEMDQKYKEGKCVLDRYKLMAPDGSVYLMMPDGTIYIMMPNGTIYAMMPVQANA